MPSKGVNKVIIIGHLGQDPDLRYMPNGNAVTNITVATSEIWRDKQTGETKEKTEWHRIVIFGKIAEIAGEYLKKGSQVYIEGALQTRKWKDQAGIEKYITEIIVNINGSLQILSNKNSISNKNNILNQHENIQITKVTKNNINHPDNTKNKKTKEYSDISNNDIISEEFEDDIPF